MYKLFKFYLNFFLYTKAYIYFFLIFDLDVVRIHFGVKFVF
jgi:hypothetical protein